MSASVQWVAMRSGVTPRSAAARRSATVPVPGSSSVVSRARETTSATAAIHAPSLWAPAPWVRLPPASPSPWATSMAATPAASSAAAIRAACAVDRPWETACMPSRRVTSLM